MKRIFLLAVMAIGMTLTGMAGEKAKVVAHRGYWKTEGSAQNSIRSLVKADSIHCWGSEFDVWMTQDGKLVVNHDADVNGVVIETGTAKAVTAQTLANGEHVPTLSAYLDAFVRHPGIQAVCELKAHKNKDTERRAVHRILKMMKKKGLTKRVTYITFSLEATKEFVKCAPAGTEVYYLNGDIAPKELKAMGCAGPDYHVSKFRNHPAWIKECHDLGLNVNVWTVDKPDDLQWCIDQGADFITTNEPELLQHMLH